MVQLVDAAMMCFAINGNYIPEDKRKTFTVKIAETTAYTIEITADNLENAESIAKKVFDINKNMFEKEVTVKTMRDNSKRNRSQERIRQAFSRL